MKLMIYLILNTLLRVIHEFDHAWINELKKD